MHGREALDSAIKERPSSPTKEEQLKEIFFDLEKTYFIKASQETGERWLAEIAETSLTEYLWTYDQDSGLWHHVPLNKIYEIDPAKGKIRNGIIIPEELQTPPSKSSFHYHIHPAGPYQKILSDPTFHEKEYSLRILTVRGQSASVEDLEAAARLFRRGYKGFRIVTTVGVTSVEFDEVRARQVGKSETMTLNFTLTEEDLIDAIKKGGIIGGIEDQMKRWNENLNGIFKVSFKPFGE